MSMSNPEFDARVARINSGKATSRQTLYVGIDEVYHLEYSRRGKGAAGNSSISGALFPLLAVLAVAFGCLSFAAASWIRYRMAGEAGWSLDPLMEMAVQAGAALVVAFALNRVLNFRAPALRVLMGLGAICTTLFFHNAVHLYPTAFAQVYSSDWVATVQASTKPQSVLWEGRSYSF